MEKKIGFYLWNKIFFIQIKAFALLLNSSNIFIQAFVAKGEAPPGLPLKGAGQDSSDAQPMVT